MGRAKKLGTMMRDLPMHLRRLGFGHVRYLLAGVVARWLTYWALYGRRGDRVRFGILVGADRDDDAAFERVPASRARRIVGLGLILGFGLIFVGVSLSYDVLRAILVTLALGLAGAVASLSLWVLRLTQMRTQAGVLLAAARSTYSSATFTSWADLAVDPTTRGAIEAAMRASDSEELTIGRIDAAGRFLGLFGELPGVEPVSREDFVSRSGSGLDVVLTGGRVLACEQFQDSGTRFIRQCYHLAALYGKANVPAIHHVDEQSSRLYTNFIPGRALSSPGGDAKSENRPRAELWHRVEDQLDVIHSSGVAGLGLQGEGIMVDPGSVPWFTDFRQADTFRSTSSVAFALRRDLDRMRFNRFYGRTVLTERSARSALVAQVGSSVDQRSWYSTIDFGQGLVVGPIWITSHGPGRWTYLNHGVVAPLVKGKRVLDLGSNNGVLPMMMLRDGAAEVVGVELSESNVRSAVLVRRVFEWRDTRRYRFNVHHGDMLEVLDRDWGDFDVVTAFCSLYYLDAEDMARVVRRASELAPLMVLQANNLSKPSDRREKASLTYLSALLEDNGFPRVEVHAPPGYSRPIVVGRVAESNPIASGSTDAGTH